MWFATYRGVVRYDGYTMHTYNLRSTENGWYNENVEFLFKDKQGNIWAAMRPGGAFRYDQETDRFIHYVHDKHDKNSLPQNLIVNFFNGNQKDVWIVSSDEKFSFNTLAISRFEAKTNSFTTYSPYQKGRLHIDSLSNIVSDHSGDLWLISHHSISRFDEKKGAFTKLASLPYELYPFSPILADENFLLMSMPTGLLKYDLEQKSYQVLKHLNKDAGSLQNDTIFKIFKDKINRPWMLTASGFSLFNPATNKFTNYPFDKKIPNRTVPVVRQDSSGNFWFANSDILGYLNTQNGQYKLYWLKDGVPESLKEIITKLYIDNTNNLWICDVAGVSRLNKVRSAFTSYPVENSTFTGMIQSFLAVNKSEIYLGTSAGLYDYDLESHVAKRIKYSDDSTEKAWGDITCMLKNEDGTIAIGSSELVLFNPKSGVSHTYKYKGQPIYCTTIMAAGNSGYFVGSQFGGLLYFDRKNGKFTGLGYNQLRQAKPDKRKLDDKQVSVIYKDKRRAIWVGTYDGGLNLFNAIDSSFTSSFYRYPEMTVIDDIHEDKLGQFWIATDFTGLYLFDRKTWKVIRHFTQKDGLLSNGIDKIIEDNNGRIWVSNTLGLVSIDIKSFTVKRYTHDNALPTNNINWLPYKMSDGSVLYSTLNGFFRVRLEDLKPDPNPPLAHIETVLHSDPASLSGKGDTVRAIVKHSVELPYNQNRVTFTFVALHYSFPLANQYSYKLINFDKNWVGSQTQRSVTYNNLSPGTYTFQVKAANGDGVWNNKGDTFTLIIDAPWWTRWWAWLLYVVLFVTAIYGFVAYRSRKLLQDKKVLEHKVHIRTEEVMQQKEEIESQRDNLEKAFGDLKATQTQLVQSEKMASLGELTAGIAHEIQNPLNFVNNFSDVNAELLLEMQEEIEKGDLAEVKALSLDIYENEKKINQHGKRADSIVKGMLEHSRTRSGAKEPTDLNTMAEEFMRLSYHGLRAKDKSFNAELLTHFEHDLPKINLIQQDVGRVLLNLFNNAFYAVNQKAKTASAEYKPQVSVTTLIRDGHVVISVEDNGVGIPDSIKEKIMQPFFTTKPTGEGTGLGLSLTYDMVVKGHGGSIQVYSAEGEGSEFVISLPI